MALYTLLSAQVYISGALSTPFDITNKTSQGYPLYPLIFNLLTEPLAAYLCSHPRITGINVGKRHHTISLFADDIILMLSNAETSLPTVHQALQTFNRVSYYKVNKTKSYILNLGIPEETRQKIALTFPYIWEKVGINYLGIILTPKLEDLIKANYTLFLNSLQAKLNKLASTELSGLGRLTAFKMQILPQLLYLLRTLQLPN